MVFAAPVPTSGVYPARDVLAGCPVVLPVMRIAASVICLSMSFPPNLEFRPTLNLSLASPLNAREFEKHHQDFEDFFRNVEEEDKVSAKERNKRK